MYDTDGQRGSSGRPHRDHQLRLGSDTREPVEPGVLRICPGAIESSQVELMVTMATVSASAASVY